MTESTQPTTRSASAPRSHRVRAIRIDGQNARCATDSSEILIPRVPASYLRPGDAITPDVRTSPIAEYLATQNAVLRKARHLYFGRIGYVTQPKPDRRGEPFVRAEVLESRLAVACLNIPNDAVRSYFYSAEHDRNKPDHRTLYEVLRVAPTATPADLRLAYRMRRVELEAAGGAAAELRLAERAFNFLAHPELRSCYDAQLVDPAAPVLFPYGGFGRCVVSGELAEDGGPFFVRRILSYLPDHRRRAFRAPLRRIDFLAGRAVYRDSRRKAEVHLDPAVLPLVWDPTWNQWKHLVGSKAGLSGTFVASGKYRHNGGEWQLVQWETALPSRLTVNLPSDVQVVLAEAKRAYQRFGEHYDSIQRIRVRLEREPLDEQALSALCRQVGIPSDFDVMQFCCWKPDYDSYYYQQLKRRSQNVYSFRGEYLFQLPLAMVGEIPQLGNATYVFAKPPDVREFVRAYAATSRDDIRRNRGNVADRLGFVGRVMHGRNPRTWLRELRSRVGETVDYALLRLEP